VKLGIASPTRAEVPPLPMVPPVIAWDPCTTPLPSGVAPDDVKAPLDRFRCGPYNATLTARSCIDRQKAAAEQDRQREGKVSGRNYRTGQLLADYVHCRDCPVGPAIRARLKS
jgi:hypothetical protein